MADKPKVRYSTIALFAMTKAGFTPERIETAVRHGTACTCPSCHGFWYYLTVKSIVEDYEAFKKTREE